MSALGGACAARTGLPERRFPHTTVRAGLAVCLILATAPAGVAQDASPSLTPPEGSAVQQESAPSGRPPAAAGEQLPGSGPQGPSQPQAAPAAPPSDEAAAVPPGSTAADGARIDAIAADDGSPATERLEAGTPQGDRIVPPEGADVPGVPESSLPHGLSPWGMFLAADLVVKAVMVGLALASLVTWTIWFAKSLEVAAANMRARRVLHEILEAEDLADAAWASANRSGPAAALVRSASEEVRLSAGAVSASNGEGLKERVVSRLARIEAAAGRRIGRNTGMLATIGATAPFVGLFGTVWGIMNAFVGISQAQTTNLAVVAPGIAEALLATALGLVAAIPAVVIYNGFARSITSYRALLSDISAGVLRLVSRDLDFGRMPPDSSVRPRMAAE